MFVLGFIGGFLFVFFDFHFLFYSFFENEKGHDIGWVGQYGGFGEEVGARPKYII